MKTVAALVALFVLCTFWGRELFSILLLSWLVFAALAIFVLVAWALGGFLCALRELIW